MKYWSIFDKNYEASWAMKNFSKISVTYFSKILEWISGLGTLWIYSDASSTSVPPSPLNPIFTTHDHVGFTTFYRIIKLDDYELSQ